MTLNIIIFTMLLKEINQNNLKKSDQCHKNGNDLY